MKLKGQVENPSPPPAPRAAPPPKFHDEQLLQYKQLNEKISDLESEGVAFASEAAKKKVEELSAQRATAEGALAVARKEEKAALQAMDTVETGCSLAMLCGGKQKEEARQAENEKRLASARRKVHDAQQRIESSNIAMEAAKVKADAANKRLGELQAARSSLTFLIQMIFAEPGWADDTVLSNYITDIQQLDTQLAEISEQAETFGKGRELLSAANKKVEKGMEKLEASRLISDLKADKPNGETPANIPTDFVPNNGQVEAMGQANDAAKAAVGDYEAASEILSEVPYNNEGIVDMARAGIFQSVLEKGSSEAEGTPKLIFDCIQVLWDFQAGVQKSHTWANLKPLKWRLIS